MFQRLGLLDSLTGNLFCEREALIICAYLAYLWINLKKARNPTTTRKMRAVPLPEQVGKV
jgi:hypothetical protein